MGSILNFLAAVFLLVLLTAAQLTPSSPLFWVASTTTAFTVLRFGLIAVLLWMLIHPPKTKWLRVPLGISTLALAAWLAVTTYQGTLGFIDFVTLATATFALLTGLLESKPKEEEFKSIRFVMALTSWVSDRIQVVSFWALQFGYLFLSDIDLSLAGYLRRIVAERPRQYVETPVPPRVGNWPTASHTRSVHASHFA